MSLLGDLADFTKRLLTLENRVGNNAEEIKALHQDLKALTGFTQKVAYAVKRNEERRIDQNDILTRDLKIELLELERRLSGRVTHLQVVQGGQNRSAEDSLLSDGDGRS